MDKYLKLLTDKISALYRAYENHAFNSFMKGYINRRLIVSFNDNNTIHFALFEKNNQQEFELVDEVYIGFDKKRSLYEAVALNIFAKALGNVLIHKLNDNMYYNAKHKPYVLVIAEDIRINHLIREIITNQNEPVTMDNKIINEVNKHVKSRRVCWSFLSQIEDRTALTNEIFRKW